MTNKDNNLCSLIDDKSDDCFMVLPDENQIPDINILFNNITMNITIKNKKIRIEPKIYSLKYANNRMV